jgi:hypothetical protein
MSARERAPEGFRGRHRVLWTGGLIILLLGCYGTYGYLRAWPHAGAGRSEPEAARIALLNSSHLLQQGMSSTLRVFRREGLTYDFGLGQFSPEAQIVLGHRAVALLALLFGVALGAGAVQMGIRHHGLLRNPRLLFALIGAGLMLNLAGVVLYALWLPTCFRVAL